VGQASAVVEQASARAEMSEQADDGVEVSPSQQSRETATGCNRILSKAIVVHQKAGGRGLTYRLQSAGLAGSFQPYYEVEC